MGPRPDEVDVVDLAAHPVPDEAQAGQRALDQPPLGRGPGGQHRIVGFRVMPDQRGVDDGDPPDRLADHRKRPWLVRCPDPGQPLDGIAHRGDGPLERVDFGRRVGRLLPALPVLPVPGDPAANGAEPGVLAARHVGDPALLAVPGVPHPCMLRVTGGAGHGAGGRRAPPSGAGGPARKRVEAAGARGFERHGARTMRERPTFRGGQGPFVPLCRPAGGASIDDSGASVPACLAPRLLR